MHADNDPSLILEEREAGWDMMECFVAANGIDAGAPAGMGSRMILFGPFNARRILARTNSVVIRCVLRTVACVPYPGVADT